MITALLLAWAGLASAQTSTKLVGNTGQDLGEVGLHMRNDHAMSFTTGSDSRGYKLTGVDLRVQLNDTAPANPDAHAYTVSIHADSSGEPGSNLGTLTNPASWPTPYDNVRFSASGSGIDLAANTIYWVVLDTTDDSPHYSIHATTSGNTDSGAATGWSTGSSLVRQWDMVAWGTVRFDPDPETYFHRFAVYGHARIPVQPDPQPQPTNSQPTVSASCEPCEVARGGEVRLAATANDSDGRITGYQWTAAAGTFNTRTEAEVVWTAPERAGEFNVRVTVRDDGGATASAQATITVDPEAVPALPAAGLAVLVVLLIGGERRIRRRVERSIRG